MALTFPSWMNMSDAFSGVPGAPVAVLPWGDHFALFATDHTGTVMCAGGDPQNGLMGPWASGSDGFADSPGGRVAAVPWSEAFALAAIDSTGAVRTTTGDPQNGLDGWAAVPGLATTAGAAVTIVGDGTGVDLFAVDSAGAVEGSAGGVKIMTGFNTFQHGWHFDNGFLNELLGGAITTNGLCGGMAYSSLDYYFLGMPIPTHRAEDFPEGQTYPSAGRLHSMIYNRLLDSFRDSFGKWSCIYPDLDAAVAAALGLVAGAEAGGILGGLSGGVVGGMLGGLGGAVAGGLLGGLGGWIYGEYHEAFDCPGGGATGMTRHELPHLCSDYLDKGVPVPMGLIYDEDIFNIGNSHQVVAYGYATVGGQTLIYVYDNRYHDQECVLTVDTEKPGKIQEAFTIGGALPKGDIDSWAGLLVEDGYSNQTPSYGQDIGIASPQAVTLDGKPVVTVPTPVAPGPIRGGHGDPGDTIVPLVIAAPPRLPFGQRLDDNFTVQNFGEFSAHYQSLGIEVDDPSGARDVYEASPRASTVLAPGDTAPATVEVMQFGDSPGFYLVKAGYHGDPTADVGGPSSWLTLLYPATSFILS